MQCFGTFLSVPERANLADLALPGPRALRFLRLKRWQAMQFGDAHRFVNVAVFGAGPIALIQVKHVDWRTGRLHVFERKIPPWAMEFDDTLRGGRVAYRSRGASVTFENDWDAGTLHCRFDVPSHGHFPGASGDLTAHTTGVTPLVSSLPFGVSSGGIERGMCAQKALMPASGSFRLGSASAHLEDAFAFVDHHQGYYPYRMRWDWVTGAHRDAAGRLVGVNLTRNQARDPEQFNENALWVDGAIELLPAVTFARNGTDTAERWRVRDAAGTVDVSFQPVAESTVNLNLGLVTSRYRGPLGPLEGHVRRSDGTRLELSGAAGMAEDFYLRV